MGLEFAALARAVHHVLEHSPLMVRRQIEGKLISLYRSSRAAGRGGRDFPATHRGLPFHETSISLRTVEFD